MKAQHSTERTSRYIHPAHHMGPNLPGELCQQLPACAQGPTMGGRTALTLEGASPCQGAASLPEVAVREVREQPAQRRQRWEGWTVLIRVMVNFTCAEHRTGARPYANTITLRISLLLQEPHALGTTNTPVSQVSKLKHTEVSKQLAYRGDQCRWWMEPECMGYTQ